MDRLIVEGVRCFFSRQSVPLKPITLLVGENSSGKTTFLALARIAWDLCTLRRRIDFNEDPFLLGASDQIASFRGGRGGRAKCFTIGAQLALDHRGMKKSARELPDPVTVTGYFLAQEAQPKLDEWALDAGPLQLNMKSDEKEEVSSISIIAPSGSISIKDIRVYAPLLDISQFLSFLHFIISRKVREKRFARVEGKISEGDLELLGSLTFRLPRSVGPRPYAFSPIRTRPQRTYEPLKDAPRPEGSHVPILLAKTLSSDPEGWAQLKNSLELFGEASGLFRDVEVRRLGQKESDPFQIRVKISGPPFNLVDVGYGVSQVLPIVVDSLREPEGSTFLLQQPEVHLHPKAQAELASFLALLAKQQRKRFLIETHSDYIVDRIRMDVRDRHYLTPNDVSILYFERKKGGVIIHSLEIDNLGNIVDSLPGYRQFFLEEDKRLLGA